MSDTLSETIQKILSPSHGVGGHNFFQSFFSNNFPQKCLTLKVRPSKSIPSPRTVVVNTNSTYLQSGYKKRKEMWAYLLLTGFCLAEACKKSNSKNAIPGKTQTYVPVNCSHVFACKPQSNLPHCTVKICAKLLYALFHFLIIGIF